MSTRVYGASDDLVEFEGDVSGEVGYIGRDGDDPGCLLVFSDGTLLVAKYVKPCGGVWDLQLVQRGTCFRRIDICTDENEDPHSDVAHFEPGLKWAYAAKRWEKVQ
jgi:hypothetical protein